MTRVDRILQLVDELTLATRRARFDDLPAIVAALEKGVARATPQERRAPRLRRRLEESRSLLMAAQQGVQSARQRIAAVTEGLSSLNTYDAQGKRLSHLRPADGFERRA